MLRVLSIYGTVVLHINVTVCDGGITHQTSNLTSFLKELPLAAADEKERDKVS